MRLFPLHLTAAAASWRLDGAAAGQASLSILERDGRICRFCGLESGRWAEVYHLDSDHENNDLDNLACSCPACHACQHLGRESAEHEYLVIWLPKLTQAALNHLVRGIHYVFRKEGEAVHIEHRPTRDTPALRSAYTAYRELAACAASVRSNLGSASPVLLGEALLNLPPAAAGRAAASDGRVPLVGGLRLLSRGRLYRDGVDVYPDCLDDWAGAVSAP